MATIADWIVSGSSGHASITSAKSLSDFVSLLFCLWSSLSELVTLIVLVLSLTGTLEGSFGVESPSALFDITTLFVVDLGVF